MIPALITPNQGIQGLNALVRQPNGKLLIGGEPLFGPNPARLNPDANADYYFNPGGVGADGTVSSILRPPGGKALVGGTFAHYNGTPVGTLVRVFASSGGFNAADFLLLLAN